MSLQPIDLQTLFARLSSVSREQAALKDGLIQSQAVVGSELIRKGEEEAHTVTQPDDIADGPENLHDDDESQQKGEGKKDRRKEGEAERKREVFREPYLGKNVDLSG